MRRFCGTYHKVVHLPGEERRRQVDGLGRGDAGEALHGRTAHHGRNRARDGAHLGVEAGVAFERRVDGRVEENVEHSQRSGHPIGCHIQDESTGSTVGQAKRLVKYK